MERQLGWAISWVESLGISKVSQTVLVRLVVSQIWHQFAGSVWDGLEKGQWLLFALMPDISVPHFMPLMPSSC